MVATMAEYASSLVSIIEEAEVQAVVILSELPMVVVLKQEVKSTISVPIQVQQLVQEQELVQESSSFKLVVRLAVIELSIIPS